MTAKEKVEKYFEYGQFMTSIEIANHEKFLSKMRKARKERERNLIKKLKEIKDEQ